MSARLPAPAGAPASAPALAGAPTSAPTPALAGQAPRPGAFCRELVAALEASDGRRRRRKRDTTPDAIGLGIKRRLLEEAAADDPEPEDFEGWLLDRCLAVGPGNGGVHAMALSILEEWRLAAAAGDFRAWLAGGARSDDALPGGTPAPSCGRGGGEG